MLLLNGLSPGDHVTELIVKLPVPIAVVLGTEPFIGATTVIATLVIVVTEELTVIESDFVALPAALVALTVKLNVPLDVGVPEIVPLDERLRPPGNEPLWMLHVIGVVPVAARVWL